MANIQIFEINEDGELLVNDPALAGALQELKPEELKITGGGDGVTNYCTIENFQCPPKKVIPK
ncbi:MAG: hypothetical protein ACKPKP_04795 [Dolichospermum sp.]